MKLIDKADIVAEITDWRNKIKKGIFAIPLKGRERADAAFEYEILGKVRDFLDTFEAKEVNIEKELDEWIRYGPHTSYPWCTIPDAIKITARHFYELGLNVSNPTSQNAQDLIKKYVSDHAANRWLDASELEKLLNNFVLEYDVIKNREYEQQCKCKSK